MISIMYISDSLKHFNEKDLDQLCELCAKENSQVGITGYLCYKNGRFFQYIEGKEQNIYRLMKTISSDSRHKVLYHFQGNDIEKRLFPKWGMRHIKNSEIHQFQLEKYVETNLLYMKDKLPEGDQCKDILTGHINAISKIRTLQGLH